MSTPPKWITEPEIRARYQISRTTWWRWRKKHTIRTKQTHKNGPILYNVDDLDTADLHAYQNNPTHPRV